METELIEDETKVEVTALLESCFGEKDRWRGGVERAD